MFKNSKQQKKLRIRKHEVKESMGGERKSGKA